MLHHLVIAQCIFVVTTIEEQHFYLGRRRVSIRAVPLPASLLSNTDPRINQADALNRSLWMQKHTHTIKCQQGLTWHNQRE